MRLLLARHGQSEWNELGRWQGQADPPLSELGRRQAAHAAERLGALDAVVASDLERARATADIVADLHGIGPVLVEGGLRERDAGEWAGSTKDEIDRDWPGYLDSGRRPPGFEPEGPFRARVLAALARVQRTVGDGEVLVVTHAGVVYQVEKHLGAPFERLANLGGRWVTVGDDGDLRLGERLLLVDPDELTVPGGL